MILWVIFKHCDNKFLDGKLLKKERISKPCEIECKQIFAIFFDHRGIFSSSIQNFPTKLVGTPAVCN